MSNQKELNIEGLKAFIEKASKLGKYPANTAIGYLTAVKTAERALLNDEPKTIEYLISHIEELFVRQDNLKLSPQSLPVYINRIKSVCNDFTKYGSDGSSIYNWNRTSRIRTPKTKEIKESKSFIETPSEVFSASISNSGQKLNILSWRLRPGLMIKIELPEDLNEQDVEKIKALLDIELRFGH